MPEDTYAEDRVTHGKSPLHDPAQHELRRRERAEHENPAQQLPNHLTTIDKATPQGGRAMASDAADLRRGAGDEFKE